jgi:hypothetical protein
VIAATTPLTGVAIAGTPQVGDTLTARLTPSDATASYQWQECATQNGTYTAISGATSSTYAPVTTDVGKYIEVVATGSSGYSGSATSLPTGVVRAAAPVPAALSTPAISGAAQVGVELMASVTPSDAAVTYQWVYSTTGAAGSYSDITGATGSSYTIEAAYLGDCIKVVATLATTDATYTAGSATSAAAGPVTIPLTAVTIGYQVNADYTVTVTVEGLTPSDATANYQWLETSDGGASYTPISGATSSTYATDLNVNNLGTYNFKVVATGMGNYSGTVTSGPLSF